MEIGQSHSLRPYVYEPVVPDSRHGVVQECRESS
jgi:hypothetical protein